MVWPVSCVKSVVLLTMPWCGAYLDTCGKPGFQASAAKQQEDGPIQYPLQAPVQDLVTLSQPCLNWRGSWCLGLRSWVPFLAQPLGPALAQPSTVAADRVPFFRHSLEPEALAARA